MRRFLLVLCALLLLLGSCAPDPDLPLGIVVASKLFTENNLLAEICAQWIEDQTGLTVERRHRLGGTSVCFTALQGGEVDLYVDYTGTLYSEVIKGETDPGLPPEALLALVTWEMREQEKAIVGQPLGPNNTYALAMSRAKAEALGVETISELAALAPHLVFAANNLFYTRVSDGYDTLVQRYGLTFASKVTMESDQLYPAADSGQVDVLVVYATDSQLLEYDMVILEDDKRVFSDYHAVPVLRPEALSRHPELEHLLAQLANRIDNETMRQLNQKVDNNQATIEQVAQAFLAEAGLIKS